MITCPCGGGANLIAVTSKKPMKFYYVCLNCGRHTEQYESFEEAEAEWMKMYGNEKPDEKPPSDSLLSKTFTIPEEVKPKPEPKRKEFKRRRR